MAGKIDMTKFTFCGDVIKGMSEFLFDEVIKGGEINKYHQIWAGIVAKGEIGFLGKAGILGIPTTGCSPAPQDWTVATRKMLWDPATWEFLVAQCFTDLENSAAVYSLKCGKDIADFTDTDYQAIIYDKLKEALLDMMWRFIWFGDTAAKNVTGGGIITDGVDVKYFTLIDGFFKQMITQGGINPKQLVAITENAGATYVAQELTGAQAKKYLGEVYKNAPTRLKGASDKVLYVTRSVYDAYEDSMGNSVGCCTEGGRDAEINGVPLVLFKGIPLQPMDIWDETIASYEDTGTKLNNPNRIVFTTKGVLAVGVDCESSFDDFNTWYDKNSRTVKSEGFGKLDAKLADPELFVIAI